MLINNYHSIPIHSLTFDENYTQVLDLKFYEYPYVAEF